MPQTANRAISGAALVDVGNRDSQDSTAAAPASRSPYIPSP
jgi:hypothetical protein